MRISRYIGEWVKFRMISQDIGLIYGSFLIISRDIISTEQHIGASWKKGRLSRGGELTAWEKGRLSSGDKTLPPKKGELSPSGEPTPWEKGEPARGVELALREKGGRNGVLSMGAFCVEAGVSPRDGSGYKKGGTDLSQVRPAEVKCYKSGYKKPSGWEAVLNLLSDYLRSCLGRSFSFFVSGLSGPVSALLFHH